MQTFTIEKRWKMIIQNAIIYVEDIHLLQSDDPKYMIYNNDEKFRLMKNLISDSYKVDIERGHRLYLCKKQDKDNEKRCHFQLIGTPNGHEGGCTCGACNYTWCFEEANYCDCE